jgi:hypothetical protein
VGTRGGASLPGMPAALVGASGRILWLIFVCNLQIMIHKYIRFAQVRLALD